jgi:hypothetical protein
MRSSMPVVGEWYRRVDGAMLEVVAIDDGNIEVQHFDGTLEEFDNDEWQAQGFATAKPPEDWSGSVDVEPEDIETSSDGDTVQVTWSDPLNYLDRTELQGYSEWPTPPAGHRLY